jgi:hypothetical protein
MQLKHLWSSYVGFCRVDVQTLWSLEFLILLVTSRPQLKLCYLLLCNIYALHVKTLEKTY